MTSLAQYESPSPRWATKRGFVGNDLEKIPVLGSPYLKPYALARPMMRRPRL
jgi:hypothetical protein